MEGEFGCLSESEIGAYAVSAEHGETDLHPITAVRGLVDMCVRLGIRGWSASSRRVLWHREE